MLVCPGNLPTVYRSPQSANDNVAIECLAVWKLTFFSIAATRAITATIEMMYLFNIG